MKFISLVISLKNINNRLSSFVQVRTTKDEFHNMLEFPGGKVEVDEDPKIAAIRELEEETQTKLDLSDLVLAFIYNGYIDGGKQQIRFYIYITTKMIDSNGEYKALSELLYSNIPSINKDFLREYSEVFKNIAF